MVTSRQSVLRLLQHFIPLETSLSSLTYDSQLSIEALGNHGGYSGAQLWKISLPDTSPFCLRRWPAPPSEAGMIEWIHQTILAAVRNGFPGQLLPVPQRTVHDNTLLISGNQVFELSNWLPGTPDFHSNPNLPRIQSAAATLASFHQKCRPLHVQQVNGHELKGVRQRIDLINHLKTGLIPRVLENAIDSPLLQPAQQLKACFLALEPEVSQRLGKICENRFEQQICIRDIWHDHLFFRGNEVSGIIDFGAMGFDNRATDLARLFGSLFANNTEWWGLAIDSYQSIYELSDLELELIEVYDRSSAMLAGWNWLKWILIENRKFDSWMPILGRIEALNNRMRDWL